MSECCLRGLSGSLLQLTLAAGDGYAMEAPFQYCRHAVEAFDQRFSGAAEVEAHVAAAAKWGAVV